jgi:hypothetical protein
LQRVLRWQPNDRESHWLRTALLARAEYRLNLLAHTRFDVMTVAVYAGLMIP